VYEFRHAKKPKRSQNDAQLMSRFWLFLEYSIHFQAWCKVLHVLVHYFMVANYFWMFCEGFYLHTLLVLAFIRSDSALLKGFYVFGWAGPLLPILIYVYFRATDSDKNQAWVPSNKAHSLSKALSQRGALCHVTHFLTNQNWLLSFSHFLSNFKPQWALQYSSRSLYRNLAPTFTPYHCRTGFLFKNLALTPWKALNN